MSVPIPLRVDFEAVQLRGLARKSPCLAALHYTTNVSYFLGRVTRSNRM